MRSHQKWQLAAISAIAVIIVSSAPARAAFASYTSQTSWAAAVGDPSTITVFHFDGPTETSGKAANDPTIVPSYSSRGVNFLPFDGTSVFPAILRGQSFRISDPSRDGLLTNNASPNTDLEGRAIWFDFNQPERAVGTYFNGPYLGGDGGYIEAFNAANVLIGQTPISAAGGFVGLVSDSAIAQVHIVNTFNSDLNFGIWNLQFSPVPEPSCVITLATATLLLRRRDRESSIELGK